jgi:tRNA(fMet)-specific endonuclease VapC
MNRIQIEDMAIYIVTIAELQFGAYNSGKVQKNLERIQYLRNIIQTINLDITITEEYAKIKSKLRKIGNLIDDLDILIGATAIVNGLTIITNNEQYFNRIDNIFIENRI